MGSRGSKNNSRKEPRPAPTESTNSEQASNSPESDTQSESEGSNASSSEDLEEPHTPNTVSSNENQVPPRRITQPSIDSHKQTPSASQRSTPSIHVSTQVQNNPPSTQSATRNAGQMNPSSNDTHQQSSSKKMESDGDDVNEDFGGGTNENQTDHNSTTPSPAPSRNLQKARAPPRKNIRSTDRQPITTLNQNIDQPLVCPYCHRGIQDNSKKVEDSQLPWIKKDAPKSNLHINMDEYDEEFIQKKIYSEHGRLRGVYDYFSNIVVNERDNNDQSSVNYTKQTPIARYGSLVSPTHTPYPDYDLLQRHEHRLNKPFTSNLYSD
ncbi:unnamed protein product [Rotaria sp. Silwood1]|nr:unnamed protein product [Rotaria sp. Silwood1]CAF0966518.1 unnamed protein product [Rotaria sp. Silwood1]CAF3414293.1 unnamed protein product [Rotaria sp. Silwood1]CAF4672681.1 unnamed protein product [Rotaria sp. Silwood1]CAF4719829.1 unnamed protein product [Rotaria sp. Silwood1]